MLTIIAWIVFVPAVFWNIIFFGVVFWNFMDRRYDTFRRLENYVQMVVSLLLLFVPGIYLFGW
jgi:hypothetical protein